MKTILAALTLGLFTFTFTAHSAVKLDSLISAIAASNERIRLEEGELRTLSRVVPRNLRLPRTAEYLNLLGLTIDGHFLPMHMGAVSEIWTFDGAMNWKIEQWVFRYDLNEKKLAFVSHREIRETLEGKILDNKVLPSKEADDPESMDQWEEILNKWMEWRK